MIKCCIFDLDGTLLDTITTITHFVNVTLQRWGIKEISIDECKAFVGDGARKLIERACENGGVTDEKAVSEILASYKQTYDANPLYLTGVYDGLIEMLDELEHRGIKLAILSNKPDDTVQSVVKEFFGDRFAYVAGGKDGVPLKPNPDCTREILTELSVSADEVMFVGDTSVDVETGKNMGAGKAVGVLWGFREREELESAGADVIVSGPLEILENI